MIGIGIGPTAVRRPSKVAPFQKAIPGLWAWYRADVFSEDGSVWPDQSGNGRDATVDDMGHPGVLNATAANGKPAILGGPLIKYHLPSMTALTAGEGFVVVKTNTDPAYTDSTDGGLWLAGTGTATVYNFNDGVIYDSFGTDTRKTTVVAPQVMTNLHVYNVTSVAGEWTSRVNGTDIFTTATNVVAFPSSPLIMHNGSGALKGAAPEFAFYSRKLTTPERTAFIAGVIAYYSIT